MSLEEYEAFFFGACHSRRRRTRGVLARLRERARGPRRRAGRRARAAHRRARHRSPRRRRGADVDRRRRPPQHARRRGLHEPGRDRDGGRDPLRLPGDLQGPARSRTSACASRAAASSRPRRRAASDYLRSLLDLDEGADVLGEIAFGLNYEIDRFTRNILFDEKIGGTMHLALGAASRRRAATNAPALHWDLICDLRADGEVYADGELVWKAGLIPDGAACGRRRCADPRVARLAEVLVGYSPGVEAGRVVLIDSSPPRRAARRASCYRAVLAAGGHPRCALSLDGALEALLGGGQRRAARLGQPGVALRDRAGATSASSSRVPRTRAPDGADPARRARLTGRASRCRPAASSVSSAGESAGYGDALPDPGRRAGRGHVAGATTRTCLRRGLARPGRPGRRLARSASALGRLAEWLETVRELRIVGRRTPTCAIGVERPQWIRVRRHAQLPGRRGLHRPGRDERRGRDPLHATRRRSAGGVAEDASLRFEGGEVVDGRRPRRGRSSCDEMLALDEGARRAGRVRVRAQRGDHRRSPASTLFDEKIGGTVPPGARRRRIPRAGGTNSSALHWDMVCDLRAGRRGLRGRRARLPRRPRSSRRRLRDRAHRATRTCRAARGASPKSACGCSARRQLILHAGDFTGVQVLDGARRLGAGRSGPREHGRLPMWCRAPGTPGRGDRRAARGDGPRRRARVGAAVRAAGGRVSGLRCGGLRTHARARGVARGGDVDRQPGKPDRATVVAGALDADAATPTKAADSSRARHTFVSSDRFR